MINKNGAFAPEGLNVLLKKSGTAQDYYSSLPEYIREMLDQRSGSIQSEDDLRHYAENLLQGDK